MLGEGEVFPYICVAAPTPLKKELLFWCQAAANTDCPFLNPGTPVSCWLKLQDATTCRYSPLEGNPKARTALL